MPLVRCSLLALSFLIVLGCSSDTRDSLVAGDITVGTDSLGLDGVSAADVQEPDLKSADTLELPDGAVAEDVPSATDVARDLDPDVPGGVDAPEDTFEAPGCGEADDEKVAPHGRGVTKIVAGQSEHDPAVVDLTSGQVLAIGAIYTFARDWWTGEEEWFGFCTGTLIADDWVLTAAHCLEDVDLRDPHEFRLGTDGADPDARLSIDAVYVHPDYNPRVGTAANDVGLAHLSTPASEEAPSAVPIPYNKDSLPSAFSDALVQNVGYGATSTWGNDNNTLRWWTVEEVTAVTRTDFTVYGGGVSSVCFGDSGGPSLWTFPDTGDIRIVGVVSWGDPSCVDYDHFARLDDNADWIADTVPSSGGCGDVPEEGRCEAGALVRCEPLPTPHVVREDCAANGWLCKAPEGDLPAECDPGACDTLTFDGLCAQGDIAQWCNEGIVHQRRCLPCDQTCGFASDGLGHYCR